MQKSRFTQVKTAFFDSDPAEARTQDPQIKSLLLYQLSYEVIVTNVRSIKTIINSFFDFFSSLNRID